MKYKFLFIITVFIFALNSCTTHKITREKYEWSDFWKENEPDRSKPRVLFIGNSILKGYFRYTTERISDKVNCDRFSTSRSIEDPVLLQETKLAIGDYQHQIIHFNNGLHGWHLSKEEYRKCMKRYVKFLKRHKSKDCILLYSLTTPVSSPEQGVKLDPVRNKVVLERNEVALEIMAENGIQVIDLYGLVEPELDKYVIRKGDLHYKKEGYDLMAEKISKQIISLLKQ
ncbi:SGNH/GDSL hydrolase family protein [uncultured Draconibacterium sp.]|uniref:SGNH/GDSL hydrolase family protein n=1 Tax=uncultured Draconibacterium sp. TaxID=1573823 RepID=UPI0025E74546|nr:SGNH/GDSL hydrolase family protein [uncultured Draconibacterium sp.]